MTGVLESPLMVCPSCQAAALVRYCACCGAGAQADPEGYFTGQQLAGARGLLGWDRQLLARNSRVSYGSIQNFELGRKVMRRHLRARLRRKLEENRVRFVQGGVIRLEPPEESHD